MNIQEAKNLFCRYDGSRFGMWREGVEEAYLQARVPPELETLWLDELKSEKLRQLSQKGNRHVIWFFQHHSDLGHLADFIAAEPRGMLWERCSFLERLLEYTRAVHTARRDDVLVPQAVRKVVVEAERLLKRARSEASIKRVREVLAEAQHYYWTTPGGLRH